MLLGLARVDGGHVREKKGRLLHQLQMLNSPALEMYHEKDGKSELPPPARDHGRSEQEFPNLGSQEKTWENYIFPIFLRVPLLGNKVVTNEDGQPQFTAAA